MKKSLILIFMAVAMVAGCQKDDDTTQTLSPATMTIKVNAPESEATRPIIKQDGDKYLARWCEDDIYTIGLAYFHSSIGLLKPLSLELDNDGQTAVFTFPTLEEGYSSYSYYLTNSTFVELSKVFMRYELADTQLEYWELGSYGNGYDLVVSSVVTSSTPLTGEFSNFKMTRLNAVLKLTLDCSTLDTATWKYQTITFACQQPIAGQIDVMLDDLDGKTYPVPFTIVDGTAKSAITTEFMMEDNPSAFEVYIATLPATLKAGESYTITVTTNSGSVWTKSGTLKKDLILTAGDVTLVNVDMKTATLTPVE